MCIDGYNKPTYYSNGSDTEACSYSISEAREYGVQTITTPLPYLEEFNITNENAIILDFDCSNIKDVVEQIKRVKKVSWHVPEDNYRKYLADGKSKYERKVTGIMKKIKAVVKFQDIKHGSLLRKKGDEFIEEDARADDLISRGFCELVEVIKPKEVAIEKAVKEEKKETAVKEKATRKKKDAKK